MRFFTVALIFSLSSLTAVGQTNFRTNGTGGGDWNVNGTWEVESPDGSNNWVAASSTPTSASGTILIRNGDAVNVTANVTIDQTTVQAGGSININTNNRSLTLQNVGDALVVEGTVTVSGTGTASLSSPAATALVFQNGGIYEHARNTGTIPTATWVTITNPNSLCRVTGTVNTAGRPGGLGQNFYNFTWDAAQTGTVSLAGLLLNIANDLIVNGTNNQQLQFATTATPSGTITIGRDFNIENNSRVAFATTATNVSLSVGRDFNYNSTNATGSFLKTSGSYTITVSGNFNMNATGGLLRVSGGANDGTFDLFGDFTLTAGTINETGAGGGVFNFRKTGTQVFTNTGTIATNMDYVVFGTSTLDIGTSVIDGDAGSSLTLNASARLIVGSTNSTGAIVTGASALGNVSVTTRTYNAGSRIIYGGSAAQFIGNGHPNTAGVETEIDNSSVGGVTFNTTTAGNSGTTILSIPGDLFITDGDLNIVSSGGTVRSLTLNGNVSATGGNITFSGTTSDLVINGTGALGTFPFPSGAHSLRNFTLNRTSSGSVAFTNQLTMTGTTTLTNGDVDFNGTTTLTGAVSIASNTLFFEGQSLTIGGNFTRTSGFLSADASSTLTLTGGTAHTSALAFSGSGNTLNSLIINKTAGGTACSLNSPLTITTALTLSDGAFANTSGLNFSSGATLTRNNGPATASITGAVPTGGPYNLVYTGSTSFTTGVESQGSINNYSSSHTATITMGNNITVAGTWTKTAGTFSCSTFTLTVDGNFTNTGTFNAGTGTVAFNNNTTLSGTTGINFFNIVINNGATLIPEATLTIQGSFQNDGTFTQGTGAVIFSGATGGQTISGTTSTQFYDLTSNKSNTGVSITLNSPIGVSNTFTLTNGEWTTDVVNNITMGGVSSTLARANTASFTAGDPAPAGSYDLVLSGAGMTTGAEGEGSIQNFSCSNSGIITMGTDIGVSGTWTKTSGTFSCSTFTLTIGGDFTNTGTFNANTGTVAFNGNTTLSGTTTINFNNITINSGATLTPEATLNITRDFTNNSSSSAFVAGSGTVIFIGNGNVKNIGGTAVTTFNNLTINAGGAAPDAQLEATAAGVNLTGVLSLAANATFDADGSTDDRIFTLLSSADSPVEDARIGTLSGSAAVQGNVTAQRYMSLEGGPGGNNRIYRYISSPLTNATVADIQNEIPVTGSFTGTSTCTGCNTNQSMFSYDETVTTGGINGGYVDFPASNATENLVPGIGYALFVRGNVDPILTAGSALWDVSGPINSGTINYPVTFTNSGSAGDDGWNLIGNPYPCTIDWNAGTGWSANKATALDGSIYMRDNGLSTPQVAVWNGTVGTFGASRYIPMGQAFWVKASSNATITSNENIKVTNQTPNFLRTEAPFDYIRLSLENASVKKDEAIIHFRSDATDEFDAQSDAWKLFFASSKDNLSTLTPGNLKLTINSLPPLGCGRSVNLHVSDVSDGTYRLNFTDFDSFEGDITIRLEDHFTGQTIDVLQQSQYDFTVITATPATFGSDRFTLKFEYGAPSPFTLTGNDACVGSDASISIADSRTDFTYDLVYGTDIIQNDIVGTGGELMISIPDAKLVTGANSLQLISTNSACSTVSLTQTVVVNKVALPEVSANQVNNTCGSDAVTLQATGATDGNYKWYESVDATDPIANETSGTFVTPLLSKSKTYYVSAVNSLGCEASRVAIKAEVTILPEIATVTDGLNCNPGSVTIKASGSPSSYKWYESKDATVAIENQSSDTYVTPSLTESKTYYVSAVTDGGCEGERKAVTATIGSAPEASITVDGLTLISNADSGNQWYKDGAAIPGATGKEYRVEDSGIYKVVTTYDGGCTASAERVMQVTALDEFTAMNQRVNVYPNPTIDFVNIAIESNNQVLVRLINLLGKKQQEITLQAEGGAMMGQIDLRDAAQGMYIVEITDGNQVYKKKILKK